MLEGNEPLPDGELEYIETDGKSWIDTGVVQSANSTRAVEIKMSSPSGSNYFYGIVGGVYPGSETTTNVSLLLINPIDGSLIFCWKYYYSALAAASTSITNGTPFIVRVILKKGTQKLFIKEEGASDFTEVKTGTSTVDYPCSWNYRLFSVRDNATSSYATRAAIAGTRVYYAKFYSDDTFSSSALLRDFVPWRKNGIVSVWDNVSDAYYSNGSNINGKFIGGPNIQQV